MTFDNTRPTASDQLSLMELDLYHQLMDYRAANGLDPIPLSLNLTTTAGRHAADTLYNIWEPGLALPDGANLHSWSDAPYYSDHSQPSVMWTAPQRIGTDYPGYGFEISAAGYPTIDSALAGWQNSPGHDAVILNLGTWASQTWNSIGIGVEIDPTVGTYGGRIYHVWFGRESDPDGAGRIEGTGDANSIDGTAFDDRINGRAGNDTLLGDSGKDRLAGNAGADRLEGGADSDRLFGGNGRDTLLGQEGRDRIDGGRGDDTLTGGEGRDTFVFSAAEFGTDRVTDYDGDRIRITAPGEATTQAQLSAALVQSGTSVIYDHLGDGQNVIVLQNTSLDTLDMSLFLLD
ncbi:hypothetical protein QO034_07800 [Sedimentitalea sp. JM2-8]|uniref:Hemolysin-type calcium-binding repeat-containing protein n=1 Tax=Sedimentitalea xiamensis TaxID=3050037 RepID=A0ABT7FD14_9RHOB|nr:hypothetical protein [Sedimentitalea xiamensis]MDK3073009.1 hypothetical protein [Sedimentitalea xiamensis]